MFQGGNYVNDCINDKIDLVLVYGSILILRQRYDHMNQLPNWSSGNGGKEFPKLKKLCKCGGTWVIVEGDECNIILQFRKVKQLARWTKKLNLCWFYFLDQK